MQLLPVHLPEEAISTKARSARAPFSHATCHVFKSSAGLRGEQQQHPASNDNDTKNGFISFIGRGNFPIKVNLFCIVFLTLYWVMPL